MIVIVNPHALGDAREGSLQFQSNHKHHTQYPEQQNHFTVAAEPAKVFLFVSKNKPVYKNTVQQKKKQVQFDPNFAEVH